MKASEALNLAKGERAFKFTEAEVELLYYALDNEAGRLKCIKNKLLPHFRYPNEIITAVENRISDLAKLRYDLERGAKDL